MEVVDLRTRTEAPLQDDVRNRPEDLAKVKTLALQFEAMLMTQMLRGMKESMAPESDSGGLGGAVFGDTINAELGFALSQAGGVGLADQLLKSLSRLDETPGQSEVEAAAPVLPTGFAMPAPVAMPFTSVATAAGYGISSDFGWRSDPINGQHRFHAGVDLKVAYGQDVRTAAGGVVKFAGDQSGYGLTVVVDHGDGLETRYAHLSSSGVQTGDSVAAGQAIARSGNSGRTTGAHLHFEVRQNGQPIDPDRVIGLHPVADVAGGERD